MKNKVDNKEWIKDYLAYKRDYRVLDELTKDELIERYIYKMDRVPSRAFLSGMMLAGVVAILALLIG